MRLDTDQPVVIEPTVGRTNYQNEIAVLNGCNIPLIAHCDLLGLDRPHVAKPSRRCRLVDGIREVRSAHWHIRSGCLTYRRWLAERRGPCRYMTFRSQDPGPAWASLRQAARGWTADLIELLLGRTMKEWLKRALRLSQ
jgi:hypothetical protein